MRLRPSRTRRMAAYREKGFEGSCVPGKGSLAEAPRVAWLIPMSHSRSAAGVWKRDEPQGRLRDATSPQGDARSKPSKSGGTTRTEGAGGLATPAPQRAKAARESTGSLERTERAVLMRIRADADHSCRWRGLTGTTPLRAAGCCTLATPREEACCRSSGHQRKSTPLLSEPGRQAADNHPKRSATRSLSSKETRRPGRLVPGQTRRPWSTREGSTLKTRPANRQDKVRKVA